MPLRRLASLLSFLLAMTAMSAASGEQPLGSPALVFERTDLAQAGVGDMGAPLAAGGGTGELLLEGVDGEVTLALLYWHGVDLQWPAHGYSGGDVDYDEADIVFAGQPITGTRLAGNGYNNNWGDGLAFADGKFSAALYRADVTHLVAGSGSYAISGLADGAGHSASGASLIVFHDDGDPFNDLRVEHYEAMDSNALGMRPAWNAQLPIEYVGGRAELVLHVADGHTNAPDGEYRVRVFPGLLPHEDTDLDFDSPHVDGEPLWGGRSVPRMGFPRPNGGGGLWDIRRFDLTPAFHKPGGYFVHGAYHDDIDFVSLLVLQLVQSAPGAPPAITPAEHHFGDMAEDTPSAVQRFTFRNRQNDAITVGTVLRGNTAFALVANTCTGAVLTPAETCSVDVQCTPSNVRDYDSVLEIAWEDAFGEEWTSRARMRCAGTSDALQGRLAVDPPEAWLGAVTAGGQSALHRFTVSSIGTDPVTLGTVQLRGLHPSSFRLHADACSGVTLAPGQQCSVDLQFRPDADEALLSKRAELWFRFTADVFEHPWPVVPVAGTAVPDGGAIFRDGFEP